MARYTLPEGRHALRPVPQPGARHAVRDERPPGTVPAPVRRGIAVAAVLGGALSVGGAASGFTGIPAPRDPQAPVTGEVPAIGLAADGRAVFTPGAAAADGVATPPAGVRGTDLAGLADDEQAEANKVRGSDLAALVRKAQREARERDDDKPSSSSSSSASDDDDAPAATTPSTGPATAPATTPRTGGSADLPSQIIDTADWYLTLPTGRKGSPDTVQPGQLKGYESKFFQVNPSGDGVVFTANAGGVTTKNSKYPRSELREMDGGEMAKWDGRKGDHTITVDQAITQTPSNKGDVIGLQIHNATDDVAMVQTNKGSLIVKYADGKKRMVLEQDYKLGTRYTVSFEASGGDIKVVYNGKDMGSLGINASSAYFKTGAYVNSNTSHDSASAQGQVVLYDVDVKHTA